MLLRLIARHWLKESGLWLKNVYQTHLVLASGMIVQQRPMSLTIFEKIILTNKNSMTWFSKLRFSLI